jgi:hypothetical protein
MIFVAAGEEEEVEFRGHACVLLLALLCSDLLAVNMCFRNVNTCFRRYYSRIHVF